MSVVDLAASQAEAGFVKKALAKFGLPTDIGAALAALAGTIRDHRHLETLLTGIDAEERQMVYDSLRPHLKFTPKPLDSYIASAGQRAEREQWPILDAAGNLREFRPAQDSSSIEKQTEKLLAAEIAKRTLTMTCSRCLRQEAFYQVGSETNVDVVLKARRTGWVYDPITVKESCPKCSSRPDA